MKTIGLLGCMQWESTLAYYRAINQGVRDALGGLHSAKMVMNSVDFAAIDRMQRGDDWDGISDLLCEAARAIQAGGADFLVIGSNSMHKVAPQIEAAVGIPVVNMVDAVAEWIVREGIDISGLVGTSGVMDETFYKGRLIDKFSLEVITPDKASAEQLHDAILADRKQAKAGGGSKKEYLQVIEDLAEQGADAVILGSNDLCLLLAQTDTEVPLLNAVDIHASKAVNYALGDSTWARSTSHG